MIRCKEWIASLICILLVYISFERHLVSQGYREQSNINVELESLNNDFADVSYVCGWWPTSKDTELFDKLNVICNDELARWPYLNRWHVNMKSFTQEERLAFPSAEASFTSLAEKIDLLKITLYVTKDMLDKKVRQSVACKQSCHKLLHHCEKQVFDFSSYNIDDCMTE